MRNYWLALDREKNWDNVVCQFTGIKHWFRMKDKKIVYKTVCINDAAKSIEKEEA